MAKGSGIVRNVSTKQTVKTTENKALELHKNMSNKATRRIMQIIKEHETKGYTIDNRQFKFGVLSEDIASILEKSTGIKIKNRDMYTGASSLFHHRKGSKFEKGKVSEFKDIANMPINIGKMKVFLYKNTLVFSDGENKYVMVPNYEIKLSNGKTLVVNHVSSSRIIDKNMFTERNGYKRITL